MGKNNRSKTAKTVPPSEPVQTPDTDNKIVRKGLTVPQRNDLAELMDDLLQKCTLPFPTSNPAKDWDMYLELHKVIESIREKEKSLQRSGETDRSLKFPSFMNWLKENGAVIGNVEITNIPLYGYGLKALKNVSEGERFLSIPVRLMMSVESAKASSLGSLVQKDPMLKAMPNVCLALHLLNERHNPNSFWLPYLSVLPSSYTTVMYFTPEEMQELKGSPALEEAIKQCRNVARQYAYFYTILHSSKDPALSSLRANFTYDGYRWAVSTIMTRQNLIPSSQNSLMMNALIPLWDFCNHTDGKLSTDYSVEDETAHCVAFRDFKAGDQVFIFYGARTCADQLIHNGFVDPHNPNDGYTLKLSVNKNDPLSSQRSALLSKLGIPGGMVTGSSTNSTVKPSAGTFILHSGSQPVDGRLLAFLRVLCMKEDLLKHWLDSDRASDLTYEDCAVDTVVEEQGWKFLQIRCQVALRSYPTTIEEDDNLLASELSPCRRAIVQLRRSEKRLLCSALDYVSRKTTR